MSKKQRCRINKAKKAAAAATTVPPQPRPNYPGRAATPFARPSDILLTPFDASCRAVNAASDAVVALQAGARPNLLVWQLPPDDIIDFSIAVAVEFVTISKQVDAACVDLETCHKQVELTMPAEGSPEFAELDHLDISTFRERTSAMVKTVRDQTLATYASYFGPVFRMKHSKDTDMRDIANDIRRSVLAIPGTAELVAMADRQAARPF